MAAQRILVGEIGRPHGVRGLVKLRSFTADPAAIGTLGPLTDAAGTRHLGITLKAEGLAQIEGVTDRDAAALLTGTRLYADRAQLPATDAEEFYLADLIGLSAVTEAGENLGMVRDVEEHGAGAFLVVGEGRGERLLPFTRAVVPVVDIAAGRLTVILPEEIVVPPQPGEEAA
ncbi:ribosome maturation factor RimM [Plastoroseomonas hellenica]|uniref:ribosome maturation factor RimM n=1 Tax=Plastoroseomonas hellenica TaxID=2687306 RepID=UPI001BABCA36|nr:ribosome maturation factor RimM [Plastoroseomonas hellenica]MBR0642434.1 16S rRNA processing protein RimM [Plastoroseomonas hellenica]